MSEDNLVGESEETLGRITGSSRKEGAAEKGEPKTVRAAKPCFSYLQVLE